ncbi:MAG: 50S ribosomal protein L32 [Candidatus Pacebacteria bacterium]|nr:50S ribosomal protein L32 [Candidatus Paceibacterota bacterium]
MRHTSGHTKNRRSHHGLKAPRLSSCKKCGSSHLRHRMCGVCGTYKDRVVVDMDAKLAKKNERRVAKMKELGLDPNKIKDDDKEAKALDPKQLSKKTK